MTDLRGGRLGSTTDARWRSPRAAATAASTAAATAAAASVHSGSAVARRAFRRASFASFDAYFTTVASFAHTLSMFLPTRRASLSSSSPITRQPIA
eukprot:3218844-Prymnesium_polylepis.2